MPEPMLISCSRCGFETSSRRIWGNFNYLMPNNTSLSIFRTSGWCRSCANIEPVEQFPDRQKTKAEIAALEKARLPSDAPKSPKWFRWFLFSKRRAAKLRREQAYLNREILEKQMILRFLDLRTDSPCCLSCGSEDISIVDIPSVQAGEVVEIPFAHPDCGGMFTVRRAGVRLTMSFPLRTYTLNGKSVP